jgi:predicted protein tyrosine phosphatase
MTITVHGHEDLLRHIRKHPEREDCCISIFNPELERKPGLKRELDEIKRHYRRTLRLRCHDIDQAVDLGDGRVHHPPTRRDVERVIAFYRSIRPWANSCAVHCWSGFSRSTAVALGLLYLELGSEELADQALAPIRPQAVPLRTIVGHFDALLGSRLTGRLATIHERGNRYFADQLLASFHAMATRADELEEIPSDE